MRSSRFWSITAVVMVMAAAIFYAAFVRSWAMRWGSTAEDEVMRLPGDSLAPTGVEVANCAITVHAPAREVWRWVVQLGQGRGGYYSYEWLENLFAADMHNADSIVPELQELKVGDRISFQRNGPSTAVTLIQPERALVLGAGWTFALVPIDSATTRLIVRYPYDRIESFGHALYYRTIFEPAHFVMQAGMMLGIADRAERSYRTAQSEHPTLQR